MYHLILFFKSDTTFTFPNISKDEVFFYTLILPFDNLFFLDCKSYKNLWNFTVIGESNGTVKRDCKLLKETIRITMKPSPVNDIIKIEHSPGLILQ
jgi:hypothetical protein